MFSVFPSTSISDADASSPVASAIDSLPATASRANLDAPAVSSSLQ